MSGQALVGGARLPFATIDWGMALRDRINANHDYARHAADWCDPILFHDTGFGRFVWLDIQRGTCRDVAAWTDAGGSGQRVTEFTFSARTATWQKLCEGNLHPTMALATRRLKVQGDMRRVMRYAHATVAMVKSAKEVPTMWT